MDQPIIQVEQQLKPREEYVQPRKGSVYLAKNYQDAVEYEEYHGGIIFHEQGTEIYRVFPECVKGFSGSVSYMESD